MTKKGFTLIEILVVVTIMGTMIGLSLAGWNSYRNGQTAEAVTSELASNIRLIRSKAINGEKPSNPNCQFLENYQIDVGADCALTVDASCKDGSGANQVISDVFAFEVADYVVSCDTLTTGFQSLSGSRLGVSSSITVTYHGVEKYITISELGNINTTSSL